LLRALKCYIGTHFIPRNNGERHFEDKKRAAKQDSLTAITQLNVFSHRPVVPSSRHAAASSGGIRQRGGAGLL